MLKKTCVNHGELNADQIVQRKKLHRTVLVCKLCSHKSHRKYYESNREIQIERAKKFQRQNPVAHRNAQKKYETSHKNYLKERQNHYSRLDSRNITDHYVKRCLTKKKNLHWKDIPKELISLKREGLRLKRLIKERKDEKY